MRAGGRDFTVQLVHRFGGPGQAAHHAGQIDATRIADRLAHVQRFQQGQLIGMRLHQHGQRQQHALAMGGAGLRPVACLERAARRGHRTLHVLRITVGHRAQYAPVDRADAVKARAAGGIHVVAIDERLPGNRHAAGQGLPVVAVWEVSHGVLRVSTVHRYTDAAATGP
ncbi:hypothetical protein D3C81_575120 [compost metagenome]